MPGLMENSRPIPSMPYASNGARLVSPTGEELSLRRVAITSETGGGIARTVLRQRFANRYAIPLELTYAFPLPADGAVAGYEMRAGDRLIQGCVERRDEAKAMYAAACLQGRTAALVEQERPNLFTQHLGNIPASTDVTVEVTIDHKLAWLADGYWEWRFPTVVAPRYLGAEGAVPDASSVTVDVAASGMQPVASVRLNITDDCSGPPASSTHSIDFRGGVVTLGADAALDRDIVVRWVVPRQAPGVAIRTVRPPAAGPVPGDASYGLITIVPPESGAPTLARDLVLLLDVSGSMSGRSIQQLKAVVAALIDSLSDRDRLEMIAFSSNQVRYGKGPVQTTDTERRKAHAWVDSLAAGGGTELIPAIGAALAPLRTGVPRQVVVMTDGLIGFESAAIRSIRDRLPRESRLHAIGIGSTPNRAFLGPAARAGRGVEILIDADEAAVCGAERIVAATRDPVVVDVVVDGTALVDAAPRIPDLLAGSPVRSAVRLRPSGGTLVVRGRMAGGHWEHRLDVPATAAGEGSAAISSLWAREAIEDLELDLACGGDRTDIDRRIEEIAVRHSIASRLTSWVAVAEGPGVDPREPVRVERIPQALPYGMSVEGLGLASFGTAARAAQPAGIRPPSLLAMPRRLGGLGEIEESFHDLSRASEGSTAERSEFEPRMHALLDRFVRAAVGLRKAASRVDKLSHQLRERLLAVLREHRREMETGAVELRGRVLPTPGRPTATIQVAVTCELEWRPAQTATLGQSRIAVVDQGTTRPGPVMAGTMVRVELAASPDEVVRAGAFVIACGGHQLTVALDKSE